MSIERLRLAGIALTFLDGCSNSAPAPLQQQTVPAKGTVTYQGRPVPGAELTFHSENPAESGFGLTNARGEFRCLSNESGNGIAPGDYVVSITCRAISIPLKYADPESSPLTVTIEDGQENHFPLELTD